MPRQKRANDPFKPPPPTPNWGEVYFYGGIAVLMVVAIAVYPAVKSLWP